ncbi:MAG: hypothetical protein Q9163_003785 [Psora crenata]
MSFSNADTGNKPADPYKEKNLTYPDLKTKVEDLVKFMEACKFGMMTTRIGSSGLLTSRCMALAAKEGNGIDLIFHTNTESGKTDDLKSDPKINIAFLNSTGEWASISGEAEIITDRTMVRKYYTPGLKAWLGDLDDGTHDGGPEDPRIGCIKVYAKTATYALATGSQFEREADVKKGATTGQTPKVNMLREISEEELKQSRQLRFLNPSNLAISEKPLPPSTIFGTQGENASTPPIPVTSSTLSATTSTTDSLLSKYGAGKDQEDLLSQAQILEAFLRDHLQAGLNQEAKFVKAQIRKLIQACEDALAAVSWE